MKCDVCAANVIELRRGRCWGCYNRWVESRPVGVGARCCVCGERRRALLSRMELLGAWWPTCHNCAAQIRALDPVPSNLADMRTALERDRRGRKLDRRAGQTDARVFRYDRRKADRRAASPASGADAGIGTGTSTDRDADLARGTARRVAEGTSPGGYAAPAPPPATRPATTIDDATRPDDTGGSTDRAASDFARSESDPFWNGPRAIRALLAREEPLMDDVLDDLALSEIAMELVSSGDYDPELTRICDLGWTQASHATCSLDAAIDLLDV